MKKEKKLSVVPLAFALAAVCALFAFWAAWGTPVNAAPSQETSSQKPPDLIYYEPVTVESLREKVAPRGQDVVVLEPDGTRRESGRIVTGDRIEITDGQGGILASYTAIIMTDDSSSAQGDPIPSMPSQDPASSMPAGSGESSQDPASSAPAGSGTTTQSAIGDGALGGDGDGYYVFSGPVAVEELAAEISTQPHGLRLRVTAPSGKERISGGVCTGDTVETLDADGTVQSRVTAVIPGDLTGDGAVTDADLALLRDSLLNRESLSGIESRAADMDGDGHVDTSDLLLAEKSRPKD